MRLSVIIPSYNAAATIERCLASLHGQAAPPDLEIVVVDSSTDRTAEIVAKNFPGVRLHHFAGRKFPGDAVNDGLAHARGDIVAFLGADCFVERDWAARVAAAHAAGHPVVSGAIENGSAESLIAWAHYFCEFNVWIPQPSEYAGKEIASGCLSIERSLLEPYGPFIEGTYCSDTALQWKLDADGIRPWVVPAIRVHHFYSGGFREFCHHQYDHGRSFGRVRVRARHLSRTHRIMFALRTLYLPWLQLARIAHRAGTNGRYLTSFLQSWPLVFLGAAAWACGELVGYTRPST